MSRHEVVIAGTLRPDGTLELDERPNLEPGRVTVVLRQSAQPGPAQEDWWTYLQRVRAEREAAGGPFLSEQELSAYLDWLRGTPDYRFVLLQQAGALADDDTLPELLREIYRARGRPEDDELAG